MLDIENFKEIIVANWKLNGSQSFSKTYYNQIKAGYVPKKDNCLIICPPATYIDKSINKNIFFGAQDCSSYVEGAYTGEISAKILKDIGCSFCIVGHSERRAIFNDSYDRIADKLNNCLEYNIIPIFCIGETLQQKKENLTLDILNEQITKSIPKNFSNNKMIIAYEPVWAIGSGLIPDFKEISTIHLRIKNDIFNDLKIKVLYGGSVKADNYKKILKSDGVDGLLVGGSSFNLDEFNKIIKF